MTTILTREFSLTEVLGVISGYLLTDNEFSRLHELMEWLTGHAIFTHQIPTVGPYCEKALKMQFPQLNPDEHPSLASDVTILVDALKADDDKAADALLRELRARYGNAFQVVPMQPFDELEMPSLLDGLDKTKVIIIQTSSDDFPRSL